MKLRFSLVVLLLVSLSADAKACGLLARLRARRSHCCEAATCQGACIVPANVTTTPPNPTEPPPASSVTPMDPAHPGIHLGNAPVFIDITTTPTGIMDVDRGAKYPYLMIEDVPIMWDAERKMYVTYNGTHDRVMWMAYTTKEGKHVYDLFRDMDNSKTGRNYKLTKDGWQDAGPMKSADLQKPPATK